MRVAAVALLALCALPAGSLADSPKVNRGMIEAMERSLDNKITGLWPQDPAEVLGVSQGAYVQGYGAIFLSEVNLAPAAGILISLAGWRLPTLATPALRQMGQVAGGLALFVTGLILSMQRFRLNANVVLATVVVTVIQPLLAFVVARALGASPDILKMSVLMAALPSGFFGILFGANAGFSSEDSGAIVIASTVAGAGTLALSIAWLYG